MRIPMVNLSLLRTALIGSVDRKDYWQHELLAIDIKATILGHAELPAFEQWMTVVQFLPYFLATLGCSKRKPLEEE